MYTLADFREDLGTRKFQNQIRYNRMVESIDRLYKDEELKAFYPQNLFNNRDTSFIFVYSDFVVIAQCDAGFDLIFTEVGRKVVKKEFATSRFRHHQHILTITFEGEEKIWVFDNINDSSDEWADEYTEKLYELYRWL